MSFPHGTTFGGDGGGHHANPRLGHKTRLLSIASHDATEVLHEQASRSKFTISLQNDLQNVGAVSGVSIDSIAFPNTFPNVREGENTFIFRYAAPDTALEAMINADTPAGLTVQVFVDPVYGVFEFVFNQPVRLTATPAEIAAKSDYWEAVIGIPANAMLSENTTYDAIPLRDGGNLLVEVPEGFWDSDTLSAFVGDEMTQLIQRTQALYSVAITPTNPWDQKLQMNLSGALEGQGILLFPPDYQVAGVGVARNKHIPTVLHNMGFLLPPNSYSELTKADDLPRLNGEQLVYLHSSFLMGDSLSFDGDGGPDQIVLGVPVTAPYLDMNVHFPVLQQQATVLYNEPRHLREIDIELRDIYNRPLKLGGAQQMYVQARLWFS
jgi:hypothetical protein